MCGKLLPLQCLQLGALACRRVAFLAGPAYHNLQAVDAAADRVARFLAVAEITVVADQGVMHAGPRRRATGVGGTSVAVVAIHRVMLAAGTWAARVYRTRISVVAVDRFVRAYSAAATIRCAGVAIIAVDTLRIARVTARRRAGVRVAIGSTWITAASGIARVRVAERATGVFAASTGVVVVAAGIGIFAAQTGKVTARIVAAGIVAAGRIRPQTAGLALGLPVVTFRDTGIRATGIGITAARVRIAATRVRAAATRVQVVAARVLATATRALAAIRVIAAKNVRTTRVVTADVNCPARTAVFHDAHECVEVRFLSCQ